MGQVVTARADVVGETEEEELAFVDIARFSMVLVKALCHEAKLGAEPCRIYIALVTAIFAETHNTTS